MPAVMDFLGWAATPQRVVFFGTGKRPKTVLDLFFGLLSRMVSAAHFGSCECDSVAWQMGLGGLEEFGFPTCEGSAWGGGLRLRIRLGGGSRLCSRVWLRSVGLRGEGERVPGGSGGPKGVRVRPRVSWALESGRDEIGLGELLVVL